MQSAEAKKWPDTLTVTVGDIRTRIEGEKLWTMSGLEFKNTVMAVEDSAYGTVITIRDVGHLGTAHFLDVPGKPGEVEKESVHTVKFLMDGKEVSPGTGKMSIAGKTFRLERSSNIRALQLRSTVDISDGIVLESSQWHATKPIDLQMTYPLMYAWSPENKQYVFGDDNGILKRGVFRGADEKASNEGLEKTARWMGVFNPATGKGSVCYLIQHPNTADGWLQWTDAPGIYRKLRIMSFVEKMVPEGFEGTYQSAVGFFEAQESDWEAQAQRRVMDVKAQAVKKLAAADAK